MFQRIINFISTFSKHNKDKQQKAEIDLNTIKMSQIDMTVEESMVFDEIRRIGVFKKGITYEFTRDSTTSRSHLEEEESKKIIITCIVF